MPFTDWLRTEWSRTLFVQGRGDIAAGREAAPFGVRWSAAGGDSLGV